MMKHNHNHACLTVNHQSDRVMPVCHQLIDACSLTVGIVSAVHVLWQVTQLRMPVRLQPA